jgi:hypothetical protein
MHGKQPKNAGGIVEYGINNTPAFFAVLVLNQVREFDRNELRHHEETQRD